MKKAEKLSVSLSPKVLKSLRARAARDHKGNLSAAIAAASRIADLEDGRQRALGWLGDDGKMTPKEREALLESWRSPSTPGHSSHSGAAE